MNRTRVYRGSGTLPGRGEGEINRLRDAITIHQIRKLDLDVDAVGIRTAVGDFDSGIMSRREFSEGGDGRDPAVGRYESLEVVRLQGDRLNTSEVRCLSIEVERSIRSSQGIVLERVEKISDNNVGLVWTGDTGVRRTVTAVAFCGVLVRIQEPNCIVKGKVLKR